MAKTKHADVDIVVKPIGRLGGLDRIHVALIALVLIMLALLLMVSYSKPVIVTNSSLANATATTCHYTYTNGTCAYPAHTRAEVLTQVDRILASYDNLPGDYGLIPYFSYINNDTAAYIPDNRTWYVAVPALNPLTGNTFYETFALYDSNLSIKFASVQGVQPATVGNNQVVAQGVVSLSGKFACGSGNSTSVMWFIDPYETGAVQSLQYATAIENRFHSRANVSLELLYGPASQQIANSNGATNTEQLERYLLCASRQSNSTRFYSNLQSAYSNQYIQQSVLSGIANVSRLNTTQLNLCVNSVNTTTQLNRQALLAEYYNITTTPAVVVSCRYLAIPSTAENAACYSDPNLCGAT